MKIEYTHPAKKEPLRFRDLKAGDVFRLLSGDTLYMKTGFESYNVVVLSSGQLTCFGAPDQVVKVAGQYVVTGVDC